MDKSDHAKQMLEIQEQQCTHAKNALKKDYAAADKKDFDRDVSISIEIIQKYIDGLDEILDHLATEGLK